MSLIKSWAELPIGKLELIRIADKEFENDEETKILTIAGILADYTFKEMLELPLGKTRELIANTAFLYTKPKPKKISSVYLLNGTKYKALKKINEMTTAQFIDYQAIARESYEQVSEFLAIFLVPDGYKYNSGYDRDKVVDDISTYLTAEEGLGLADFFINSCGKLIRRSLLMAETKLTMMKLTATKKMKPLITKAETEIQNLRRIYGFLLSKR